MRPLRLSLEGFTCFRSEQHIDFSKLGLFAISGPTGAGKSSVLDAMTYALYGRVYRIDGISELISQGSEKLWVTLDFEVGNRTYRVHRSLRRKTKTGEAQLDELSGGDEKLMASGTRDVNPAVEQLIGLSYAAFVQAAVLPQGAFQQFLKSEPAKRRKLLVELFSLERYEEMKKAANERAARYGTEIDILTKRLEDDYADATEATVAEHAAATSKARALAGNLAEEAAELAAAAGRAKEINRLSRELADKKKQREDMARQAADRTRDQRRLDQARRAAAVAVPKALYDEAAEQASLAQRSSGDAAQEHAAAAREVQRAEKRLDTARKKSARVPELSAHIEALQKALAQLRHLQAERSRAQKLKTKRDELKEALAGERLHAKELEVEERKLAGNKESTEKSLAKAGYDGAALKRLVAAAKRGGTLRQLRAESKSCERAAAKEESDLVAAKAAYERADGEARQLSESIARVTAEAEAAAGSLEKLKHQLVALELRSHLEVGKPCPVCEQRIDSLPPRARARGLAEAQRHADTAAERRHEVQRKYDAVVASLRHLDESLKTKVAAARRARADANKALADLEKQEKLLAREVDGLVKPRGPLEEAVETARDEEAQRKERHDEAQKAVVAAEQLLAVTRERREAAHTRVKDAQTRLAAAEQELIDATRDANDLQEQVRMLAGTREDPTPDLKESLIAEKAQLEDELDQAVAEHRSSEKSSGEAEAKAKGAEKAAKQAAARADRARAQAEAAAKSAGFESVEEAGAAALDEEAHSQLEERIKRWREQSAEISGRITELEKELGGTQVSDEALARALAQEREAGAKAKTAEREADQLDDRIESLRAQLVKATELRKKLSELQRSREIWKKLGNSLRSDGFQDWVLESTFRGLMVAATARLKQLSGGRYALERRSDDGRIDVVDYDNAREARSAETLSGGETFLASLALALGLSEQVQSAGGTLLDSLFIDEGFGSLDPQSLDTAINAVESLQTGGRMVGVISHVEALHERRWQRVVVEKRSDGSVVSVVA